MIFLLIIFFKCLISLIQRQDDQEHGVHQPGADGRTVEEEIREGEREEQEPEGNRAEAGG